VLKKSSPVIPRELEAARTEFGTKNKKKTIVWPTLLPVGPLSIKFHYLAKKEKEKRATKTKNATLLDQVLKSFSLMYLQ
jgi:hypothetical protein